MKHCNDCATDKPLSEFYNDKSRKDGKSAYCGSCSNARSHAWKRDNPDKAYETQKRANDTRTAKQYGLTRAAYEALLASPCDICGAEATCVDHCHATGKVRGGLCHHCNLVLGHAFDNCDTLESCIQYLRR